MLTQPTLIPMPFANSGDANTIPETNPSPSTTSAASWTSGFPVINSTPLAAGGIPPAREDFNGAFKALSEHTMWEQSGNPYTWSEDLDYVTNACVQGSNGKLYVAKQNSGPNTDAGAQDPTLDVANDYWFLADLQLKADVDLGNVSAPGQVRMARSSLPNIENKWILLSTPASGDDIIAPADGWLELYGEATSTNSSYLYLHGQVRVNTISANQGLAIVISIPVAEGGGVKVGYNLVNNITLRFIYSAGSAPA